MSDFYEASTPQKLFHDCGSAGKLLEKDSILATRVHKVHRGQSPH